MNLCRVLVLAAAYGLAGCVGIRALDRMEHWQAQGNNAAIADEPVPPECAAQPSASPACSTFHAIRAHACLAMARTETAPDAACPPLNAERVNRWLACAADSYAKAGVADLPPQQAADLRQNRAQAFYCGAHLRLLQDGAAQAAAAMARAAQRELAQVPPDPERDLLAASSALLVAQQKRLPDAETCAAAREAARLAARGLRAVPPDRTKLANGLLATRNAAMQEAAVIRTCR